MFPAILQRFNGEAGYCKKSRLAGGEHNQILDVQAEIKIETDLGALFLK